MNISLSDATAIVDRAITRADAMGVPMNIAVVDGGGHLIANIIRIEDGLRKEHWDVIEDEVTRANSLSGLPMFGDTFPDER
jgi:predicted SnoaL-like aldol condensation-catalyzing enzyme